MTSKPEHSTVWRGAVTDQEVSGLHAAAFDHAEELEPWRERLERYSLGWVTVRRGELLVGFCNVITDGGHHAFLLDVIVHPDHQGTGVGKELVHRTIEECRTSSVDWLHVDFEADLGPFAMTEGLFRRSSAGILRV
ncbi:GNAT family N-acetyltransferase [Brachybacterium vulturis]|uniref:GNAT family N-acetyltransferase n=1 Tax=Brachybacterium vulturis TaxID=2017484 RepID=A0A291GRW6_9MICO|nr:GNAT family N-acetyltransferase [Brachybacterium vulturis]ATG52937.1 GNAT family N-acetyltransferase [Brachybacterium vulturis]